MASSIDMLRSARDFDALQTGGRSRSSPLLAVRYRPNQLDRTRYGISTGRRIGSAVERNRVRRRLRSIIRASAASVQPGWDVLIIARPAAASSSQHQIQVAFEKLLRSSGVMKGRQSAA
jgi:ribonuclease P protein component